MSGISEATSSLMAMQQASLKSEITYALAAKQQDAQQLQGEAAVRLIEDAGQLGKELGKGNRVDSTA